MKIALAVCGFLFGAFLVVLFGGFLGGGGPEWFGLIYPFLLIPANVVVFGLDLTVGYLDWRLKFLLALSVPIFYAVLGGYIGARWRRSHPPATQTKP